MTEMREVQCNQPGKLAPEENLLIKSRSNAHALHMNRLLSRLSQDEAAWLKLQIESVSLSSLEMMHKQHKPISHVYFPTTCVASVVQVMHDGQIIEAATIGCEGATGITAILGADLSTGEVTAEVPGDALRVAVPAIRQLLEKSSAFRDTLNRYLQVFLLQIMQSVACNQLHSAKQRYCRWLLMMHDRTPADDVSMTQEFMGQMLGIRRETVTQIAGDLQRDGAMRYRRGVITILDRDILEGVCCECYGTVWTEYERILGAPHRKSHPRGGQKT
jgi:CRP-like cAMP-binding protein